MVNSILIILIAGIGDVILATKAIRSLKTANPNVDIHILTNTQAVPILKNIDYIDHIWAFPIREFRNNIFQILKTIRSLRKTNFDIILNLYRISTFTGSLRMGLLFMLLKGEKKIGHDSKGFGLFLDEKVPKNTFLNRHIADGMMSIAEWAGCIPDNKGIEIFWDNNCEGKWDHLFSSSKINSNKLKIAINPVGMRENRRWNINNYALTAKYLFKKYNDVQVFILGGPGEENITQDLQNKISNDVINLSGKLSLNELPFIISKLNLLVTNDSAPMHIAAAVKTSVVAIFGPEDPKLFGPYTSPDLFRVVQSDVDCRPCKVKKCDNPKCLEQISSEEVFDKCIELLNNRNKRP